jgi:MFS family permease
MRARDLPLLFLNLAHAYDHFFMLIFPTTVLALAPAWGMSYGEALALGTASFVMFGVGSLPAGWLGDRWSRAHMMSIFFIGIGLASILTGLAIGPLSLALGLALLGLFASIYHPVATALVVQHARRTGRALGVNGVFGNMGVAAAGLVTGALTQALGWRAAFVLPGLLAVGTGLVFLRRIAPALEQPVAAAPRRAAESAPVDAQVRVFAVVAIAAILGGLVFHGTTVALPKIFEERLAGWTESIATIGLLVALVFAAAAFAQIAVGHLLDRYGARPLLPAIAAVQVLCLVVASQLWGPGMLALAFLLMLFVFGEIPINAWLVGRYAAPRWHARIYAVQYLGALGVSALAVPLIAFSHERTGGFAELFLILAGAALLVALAALLLPRTRRHAAPGPAPIGETETPSIAERA